MEVVLLQEEEPGASCWILWCQVSQNPELSVLTSALESIGTQPCCYREEGSEWSARQTMCQPKRLLALWRWSRPEHKDGVVALMLSLPWLFIRSLHVVGWEGRVWGHWQVDSLFCSPVWFRCGWRCASLRLLQLTFRGECSFGIKKLMSSWVSVAHAYNP
jgi:hypothetical protein